MGKYKPLRVLVIFVAALAMVATTAQARDQLRIVGSTTVYPYAKSVADTLVKRKGWQMPLIEKTGTGGGMKLFCAGVGEKYPDIVIASRPMKKSEWNHCRKNGVNSITEVLFGRDGISLVMSAKSKELNITSVQLYEAMARKVPVQGVLSANPYAKWSSINPGLPDRRIQVYGPTNAHGTYDTIIKTVLRATCASKISFYKDMKTGKGGAEVLARALRQSCSELRLDGSYIAMDQPENLMIKNLQENPAAFGIFSYAVLFNNRDKLKAVKINGIEPRVYTLADGSYPLTRSLYFYVKNEHRKIVPGIKEYVAEFMSDNAMGPFGYFMHFGLGVLPANELRTARYGAAIGAKMRRYLEQ